MRRFLPLLLLAAAAPAQQDYVDKAEAAGFAGGIFGAGTHGAVGASFGFATTRHLMPLVEFSYIPLGSDEFRDLRLAPSIIRSDSRAWDLNAGLHIQFPRREWRAVPYGAFGLGLIRSSVTITNERFGEFFSSRRSDNSFAVSFGGGVRYHITDSFGIRPELKVFATDNTFARLSIGVFYQFR